VIAGRVARRPIAQNTTSRHATNQAPITPRLLVVITAAMAVLTFFARWAYPVGEGILGMQLGSFPQYIIMFVLGLAAFRNDWLRLLDRVNLRRLSIVVALLILGMPVLMFLGADTEHGFEFFLGGPYWQSAAYSAWESLMCVTSSVLLLGLFRRRFHNRTRLSASMSKRAFTVYIFHAVVLVLLSYLMVGLTVHPLVKFVLLATAGTAVSFILAGGIRRIPFLSKVV
jgi:surface polysaccharide O-acyltransferase-like enzyme